MALGKLRRFCVYGNPTLDYILLEGGALVRPGGGVLYSSLALVELGAQVEAYGVAPHWLVSQTHLGRLGGRMLHSASATAFLLDYRFSPRRVEVAEISPPIPPSMVHEGSCVSVVNPVLGEVGEPLLKAVRAASELLVADAQGFLRLRAPGPLRLSGARGLASVLPYADAVHLDLEEAAAVAGGGDGWEVARRLAGLAGRAALVVTSGCGPVWVVEGGRAREVPLACEPVEDPTGAGDYFLSALAYHMLEGAGVEEAAARASEATGAWLRRRKRASSPGVALLRGP